MRDYYSTDEPQNAFQKRTAYCLTLYNSVTKVFLFKFFVVCLLFLIFLKALQFPNLKSTYAQREGSDDISAEELLKMVEDDDF